MVKILCSRLNLVIIIILVGVSVPRNFVEILLMKVTNLKAYIPVTQNHGMLSKVFYAALVQPG